MSTDTIEREQATEDAWPRIEIKADQLAYALKAVLPHTVKDIARPYASMIQIRFRPMDNAFTFTATNSYTLAESKVWAGLELAEMTALSERFDVWEVSISVEDAKRIMDRAKSEKVAPITLVLASDPHSVLMVVWQWGEVTERIPNQDMHTAYPKTGHLWPAGTTEQGPVRFGLNGDYLALFKPSVLARTKGEKLSALTLQFSDSEGRKPILVTFSDHFRGLLMPTRLAS